MDKTIRVEGLTRELSPQDRARREERRLAYGVARIATPADPKWTRRYILAHLPRASAEELAALDAEIGRLMEEDYGEEGIPKDMALKAFLDMLEPPVAPDDLVPPTPAEAPRPSLWGWLTGWIHRLRRDLRLPLGTMEDWGREKRAGV